MKRSPSLRDVARAAAPNVSILPTAARRQVKQQQTRAACEARAQLRAASPWPDERYVHPQMRQARERAEHMRRVSRGPELFVLLALLNATPIETRQKMLEDLCFAAIGTPAARQALEVIRSTMLTLGEQMDLERAIDQLNQEDCE